jgi:hypothetical protein
MPQPADCCGTDTVPFGVFYPLFAAQFKIDAQGPFKRFFGIIRENIDSVFQKTLNLGIRLRHKLNHKKHGE